jgi:cell division transport system permease protein
MPSPYFKRALTDIRDHKFLNLVTVITIGLSVLIVSSFTLFIVNISGMMDSWHEGIKILVYLEKDTVSKQRSRLQADIQRLEAVQTVTFISKADGLATLKTQMKHQAALFEDLKENPLPDTFEVRLNTTVADPEAIDALAAEIESFKGVGQVAYGQKWIDRFKDFINLFRVAGYAMCALFTLAAIFIVANTVRLILYTRQEEIAIMRLVGATDHFIKMPLYIQGLAQGAVGGLLGVTVLLAIYTYLAANIDADILSGALTLNFLPAWMISAIVVTSMGVGWLGSFLSVQQSLKE